MVKKIKSDKVNGIVTLEISKNELKDIMDSADIMVDKQQLVCIASLLSFEEMIIDHRQRDFSVVQIALFCL